MSLEDIEKTINDYAKEKGENFPSIKHHVWEEEDENGVMRQYSAWKINTGTMSMMTGDGGAQMFFDAMMKQGFEVPIDMQSQPKHRTQNKSKYIP